MADSDLPEHGILKRLWRTYTVRGAVVGLFLSMAVYVIIQLIPGLPLNGIWAALITLGENILLGIAVLLAGYIGTYLLLRKEEELLSQHEVVQIADSVARRVVEATSSPSLDSLLLENRDNAEILAGAHQEIWLSRETGATIFRDCREQLRRHLQAGDRFRIVLTDPTSPVTEQALFRSSSVDKYGADFDSRAVPARRSLTAVYEGCVSPQQQVELRYSAASLPGTIIITDPHRSVGDTEVMYRFMGHLPDKKEDRLALRFNSRNSPKATDVLTQEFLRIFRSSSKVVVTPSGCNLAQLSLNEMFPAFFGSGAAQTGRRRRSEFRVISDPQQVFLAVFEDEVRSGIVEVRFGSAQSESSSAKFGLPVDEKWKISTDGLQKLRSALEGAIAAGNVIFLANLGGLALGLDTFCERAEIDEDEIGLKEPHSRDFFMARRDPRTGRVPLSLTPIIQEQLKNVRSHLFLHFQNGPEIEASGLYAEVSNHERTTSLPDKSLGKDLADELQGSLKAAKYVARRTAAEGLPAAA